MLFMKCVTTWIIILASAALGGCASVSASAPSAATSGSSAPAASDPAPSHPATRPGTVAPSSAASTAASTSQQLPAPAAEASDLCKVAFARYEEIALTYDGPAPEVKATLTDCQSFADWRAGMLTTDLVNQIFATPEGDNLAAAEIQINCPLFKKYRTFPVCAEAIRLGILWE